MPTAYHFSLKKAISAVIVVGAAIGLFPNLAVARVPDDPDYTYQKSVWEQIQAPLAWEATAGSSDITVAIIDTGVDTWHDDLRANIWTNPYEIPDNGKDDDNNGYSDDIHGWNFVENSNDVRTSVFDNKDDPEAVRHGTIVAGLIGAVGDNGVGGTGLNWHIKLMPLRAIKSSGSGEYDDVIKAVDYAVVNGAKIISMSFVGDINDSALRDHLRAAYEAGVVVVAAAGNHPRGVSGLLDNNPLYPACYDKDDVANWLITVGAVNALDQLSSFSNYGSCVDILAPGENIFSTERYAPQFGYNRLFGGPWRGTSFAAPLVAGSVALIKSLHPEWTPDQIISTLIKSADPVEATNLLIRDNLKSGRLNISKAVATAAALPSSERSASGYYYFYNGNEIKRLNFNASRVESITTIPSGTVRAVGVYNPNSAAAVQVVALIERGPFYYLRLMKDSGELISEFSLELMVRPDTIVKRMRITAAPGTPGPFIVETYHPKSKTTDFKIFDRRGEIVSQKKLSGTVEAWTADRLKGQIIAVQRTSKTALVRRLAWAGVAIESWTVALPASAKIEAVRSGRILGQSTEQPVMIIRRGKKIEQTIIDTAGVGPPRTRLITETADPAPWRLLLADSTGTERALLFPFAVDGGIFRLTTADGEIISELKIPQLKGATD